MRLTTLICVIFALAFFMPFAGTFISKKGGKEVTKAFTGTSAFMIAGACVIWITAMISI